MAWRKWLVRGLVFSVVGVAILAALLYEAWTNPGAVRRQVLANLAQKFIGASISLDSAWLRLLGGIVVHDLRMARRDDLDRGDFLYVPSAVIYHDKEHLLDGTLAIRKVEMDRPRLRIVRERDGQFNLAGLLAPELDERVPTIVIRQGTILIEDHTVPGGSTMLEIKDVNLTVINDPLSTLTLEGTGQTDVVGAVHIQARFHRPTNAASAVVDLPDVPMGPSLVQRIAGFCPNLAADLRQLEGTGKVQATLLYRPTAIEPWSHDLRCRLTRGKWCHACLPAPLEQIEASMRCIDGCVREARLTAHMGPATVDVKLCNLIWPGHPPKCIEEAVQGLEVHVDHLMVTERTFDLLPEACKKIQRLYSPTGPVSLKYTFDREGTDQWHKRWEILPEGMSAVFEHFPYPIEAVTGHVFMDVRNDQDDHITVDLLGRGSHGQVQVRGSLDGDKASEVDLVVTAKDIPLDHKLMRALVPKSRELARTFLPTQSRELGLSSQPLGLAQPCGMADIKVFIRRSRGEEDFTNRYVVSFRDTTLKWDVFPYTWENVSGVLDIQPDHWECQNFHGTHKGGEIWVNGRSFRMTAAERTTAVGAHQTPVLAARVPTETLPKRECVQVAIRGQGILLDSEFEQALSPPEAPGRGALRNAWTMLALQGRLNFKAEVVDRPDQPQDIDVGVEIRGCTMQPEFFRYAMSDVSAGVRYKHGRIDVTNATARHGSCQLGLKEATILLKPTSGFQAWFKGIHGKRLIPDEDFLRALHPALRKGLEPLQLRNPLDVETTLTLDAPAAGQPLKIWWDGGAFLHNQVFQTGLEITGVDGEIWCKGHHNGHQFEGVTGYAALDRAVILGQPFRNLQGRIEITPDAPDVLSLYDLKADFFGGFAGGEGRFVFGPTLRYDVKLDALQVQLEQFGKHNKLGADALLQGRAHASLVISGEGPDLTGLKGNGRVEVPNGKLYRLPLLLDLLKAIGLRRLDGTAFEQARMIFSIRGPQMQIQQMDLIGNAISLRGQGTLNLDGSNVNLDFNADWGRMPQLMPSPVSDLLQSISDQSFKIKMRGKIANPRFEPELMPNVIGPIKKALGGSP